MTDEALKAIERNVRTVEQSHNWADVAELRHWYVRDVRVLTASLAEVEEFRQWLWANHGCPIAALYGDDGQMQCGACLIDFKAWKLEDITFAAHKAKLAAVEAERDQLKADRDWWKEEARRTVLALHESLGLLEKAPPPSPQGASEGTKA